MFPTITVPSDQRQAHIVFMDEYGPRARCGNDHNHFRGSNWEEEARVEIVPNTSFLSRLFGRVYHTYHCCGKKMWRAKGVFWRRCKVSGKEEAYVGPVAFCNQCKTYLKM